MTVIQLPDQLAAALKAKAALTISAAKCRTFHVSDKLIGTA
jgi:hypothetical protein